MSNKTYDILKWIVMVGLYGLNVLYTNLADIWDLPYATQIPDTLNTVGLVLGIWLGISSSQYYKGLGSGIYADREDYDE